MSLQSQVLNLGELSSQDWVLVVVKDRLLLFEDSLIFPAPLIAEIDNRKSQSHYLGVWLNRPCYLIWTNALHWPPSFVTSDLRALLTRVDSETFSLAARAMQLVYWLDHHRFCGRCGGVNRHHPIERALVCDSCENLYYPRISPCVIGLVWREKQLLLARNAKFRGSYYSVLAGFVEPGETAEQALAREVTEEVGLAIHAPHYVFSQPWPFPSQLMLGYFAQYAGGEIAVDGEEIVEAAWFDYDRLPEVPPKETISGALIRTFAEQCRRDKTVF